jgi:hypothetical protein
MRRDRRGPRSRAAIERTFSAAGIADRARWLHAGHPQTLEV